jgi:hypothetical protein
LARAPRQFTPSWGGLVLVGGTEADAEAKRARRNPSPGVIVGGPERVADRLRPYVDAGAEWLILGPVDSSDPDNASILGEQVLPLLPSRASPSGLTARRGAGERGGEAGRHAVGVDVPPTRAEVAGHAAEHPQYRRRSRTRDCRSHR